jgi:hypothetical protein
MSTQNSSFSLIAVKRFLSARGWVSTQKSRDFETFTPPEKLGLPASFKFSLPIEQRSNDDAIVVGKAIQSIAELYGISPSEIAVLVTMNRKEFPQAHLGGISVLSTRLVGLGTSDGSISLKIFDQFINETKRLLLDSAAFAVTNSPKLEVRPVEAENFLDACRFLQTARGSFVASFEVPDFIVQQHGFDRDEVTSKTIAKKLFTVLKFVTDKVLTGNQSIFSEEFLIEQPDVISYEMLRDIALLIKKSDSEEIEFALKSLEEVLTTSTGPITDIKLRDMDRFVDFVRENTSVEFPVDASGHIVELRSSNPGQDRNYVLVRRSHDHTHDLAMYLTSAQYRDAATAHTSNRFIHVTGMATQLRTKSRMTKVTEFRVVQPAPPSSAESATNS